MKAKYQKGGRKIERVQNRKNAKENRKKFKKFGTPLNKKSINSFRQKGGFSSAGIGTSYEREKRFENREKQKPDLNPPQYYEYKDGKKTIRYKDGDTYTQPPSGTTYKINRGDNTESSEMPVNKRKGGKRYQKGGKKVKSSLQYKPGFPATGNKPSPYDLKTLQKAINRDSTKVADRGMIGDFFDPGVTSGSTGPSDQYNLQINREFRDKQTGSSSEQTAKKINTMKNKKQKGGSITTPKKLKKKPTPRAEELRTATSSRVKYNTASGGKGTYGSGSRDGNKRGYDDAYEIQMRGPRSRGRKLKTKQKGGYMEPSKEIKFGGPTKKMQKGGEYGKKFDRLGKKMQTLEDKQIDNFDNKKKFDRLGSKRTKVIKKRRDIKAKKNSSSAMQKGGLTQGKGKVSTSGKSKKRNPNAKTPVDPRPSDEMTFLPPGTRGKKQKGGLKTPTANQKGLKKLPTSVRNKMGFKMMGGKMKYGMGGKKNKKFLGGLAGAIGGMKGAEGGFGQKLMGAAKGAFGGGIAGRVAGAFGGLKDGGGLQGAMQGFKGGAFGNSNPMDPNAAQDPNAAVAKKGGLRDRRKAAKKRMKKSKASAKRSAKKINSKNAVS